MSLRFLVSGGTGNWNSTTNWSTTSGGTSGASFPVAGDDVYLGYAQPAVNLTVNVASACLGFYCNTGYTGTLAMNSTITASGNTTLSSGMTISGIGPNMTNNGTGSYTLTSNGKVWPINYAIAGGTAATVTLADNWTVNGVSTFSNNGAGTSLTLNGNSWTANGGMAVMGNGNRGVGGTTNIILAGGSWTNGVSSFLGNTGGLTINSTGTTIINGNVAYFNGTLTYSSGTVITTGSTLTTGNNTTLNNLSGITWNNIFIQNVSTITNNSLLNISGTLTETFTTTWAGTAGWTTNNFSAPTAGVTITLQTGLTYTINSGMTTVGTAGSHIKFISSNTGATANLVLNPAVRQDNGFLDGTDIDSSAGQTIWTYKGVLTRTTNWNVLSTNNKTVGYSF